MLQHDKAPTRRAGHDTGRSFMGAPVRLFAYMADVDYSFTPPVTMISLRILTGH